MKNLGYILIIILFSSNSNFKLQEGDLLFQDLDSSPLCDAIELVSPGFKEGDFSHIGIVVSNNNKLMVLESIPPKVKLTEITNFLDRSHDKNGNPKVIVGRLKNQYKNAIPKAIKFAKEQLGLKYDNIFLLNNDKYYCSELIYEAFLEDSIFQLNKMTFLHPDTGDTLTTWLDYYHKLKEDIPQNELGINPGMMSLSEKINIVHIYGTPKNMKK